MHDIVQVMRSFVVSSALALALLACGGKSKPAETTPPPPLTDPATTEPATTEPAGAPTDADYERIFNLGLQFFDELGVSIEASGTDCKKMAAELDRLFAKYQPLNEDSKKLEGQPDFEKRMEAFMTQHEERVKAATAKIGAGMQACGDDAGVQAAMQRFDQM